MEIRRSKPTKIFDILATRRPTQKTYRFQEVCRELSERAHLPFGTCLALWNKHGNRIEQFLAEIKQGEIKNAKAYLLSMLKK